MLEVLQFVFAGFWQFWGCVILLSLVGHTIIGIAAVLRGVIDDLR